MKVELINEDIKQQYPYPVLKVTVQTTQKLDGGECVVLFTGSCKGFVLVHNTTVGKYDIGQFRDDWIESNFEPFYGKVVLEN